MPTYEWEPGFLMRALAVDKKPPTLTRETLANHIYRRLYDIDRGVTRNQIQEAVRNELLAIAERFGLEVR